MMPEGILLCSQEPPLVAILSQINLFHAQPSHIFRIHFGIYLCLGLPSDVFPSFFHTKTVCVSPPYLTWHTLRPLHLDFMTNSVWWVNVMVLLISQVTYLWYILFTCLFLMVGCQPLPSLQAGASLFATPYSTCSHLPTYLATICCIPWYNVFILFSNLVWETANWNNIYECCIEASL